MPVPGAAKVPEAQLVPTLTDPRFPIEQLALYPDTASVSPAPIDNTGAPIPDCASASAEVLATTMFPSANPGDIDKRTLGPDDQLAVCEIYPAAQDPMTCAPSEPPADGCASCAVGGAPSLTTHSRPDMPR